MQSSILWMPSMSCGRQDSEVLSQVAMSIDPPGRQSVPAFALRSSRTRPAFWQRVSPHPVNATTAKRIIVFILSPMGRNLTAPRFPLWTPELGKLATQQARLPLSPCRVSKRCTGAEHGVRSSRGVMLVALKWEVPPGQALDRLLCPAETGEDSPPSASARNLVSRVENVEGLYRRYAPAVLRRARAILANEQEAQDVLQEIFTTLVSSEDAFRGQSSPVTWLYRVVTHRCLNRIRDRRHRTAALQKAAAAATEEDPRPSPETRVVMSDLLSRIPAELRDVAVYYFIDEMSHEEIATILNVSRRTAGNRVQSVREAIENLVAEGDLK
jgi:RNA polymerase sigma factor (sigma-70 family)